MFNVVAEPSIDPSIYSALLLSLHRHVVAHAELSCNVADADLDAWQARTLTGYAANYEDASARVQPGA